MSERITRADIEVVTSRLAELLHTAELIAPTERLILSIGSKTYGNAYRVNIGREGSHAHYNMPIGGDYLGMTAREAYDALHERVRIISDVLYVQRQNAEAAEAPADIEAQS